MTVTTNETGQNNLYGKEVQMHMDKVDTALVAETAKVYFEEGEKLNGRLAMIGFVAALGAYATSGNLIPGIF